MVDMAFHPARMSTSPPTNMRILCVCVCVCVCVGSPVTRLKVAGRKYQRQLGNSPPTTQGTASAERERGRERESFSLLLSSRGRARGVSLW